MTTTWIPLDEPMKHCKSCVNNTACEQIKAQVKKCVKETYRFRCPVEVFVPNGVDDGTN